MLRRGVLRCLGLCWRLIAARINFVNWVPFVGMTLCRWVFNRFENRITARRSSNSNSSSTSRSPLGHPYYRSRRTAKASPVVAVEFSTRVPTANILRTTGFVVFPRPGPKPCIPDVPSSASRTVHDTSTCTEPEEAQFSALWHIV